MIRWIKKETKYGKLMLQYLKDGVWTDTELVEEEPKEVSFDEKLEKIIRPIAREHGLGSYAIDVIKQLIIETFPEIPEHSAYSKYNDGFNAFKRELLRNMGIHEKTT